MKIKEDLLWFIFLYMIAFIFILYFRKSEWNILFIICSLLLIVLYLYRDIRVKLVILLTILFGIVENICVYYKLWKYNAKYLVPYVPLWLYGAWALSIIFILKFCEYIKY